MLKDMKTNREKYSCMTVTRMRYRGPVESYKGNKFRADLLKDMKVLENKIGIVRERLEQFVSESLYGSTDIITLSKNNTVIYNDVEAKDLDVVGNKITSLIKEANS